jgi:hypothetical protein
MAAGVKAQQRQEYHYGIPASAWHLVFFQANLETSRQDPANWWTAGFFYHPAVADDGTNRTPAGNLMSIVKDTSKPCVSCFTVVTARVDLVLLNTCFFFGY